MTMIEKEKIESSRSHVAVKKDHNNKTMARQNTKQNYEREREGRTRGYIKHH